MELRKIVVGRFAPSLVAVMLRECGLAEELALDPAKSPELVDHFRDVFDWVAELSTPEERPLPCTVLSSLLPSLEAVDALGDRLKPSTMERSLCEFLVEHRAEAERRRDDFVFFRNLALDTVHEHGGECPTAGRTPAAQAWEPATRFCLELLKYVHAVSTLAQFRAWLKQPDVFPVNGMALLQAGVPKGPKVKHVLSYLHQLWKEVSAVIPGADPGRATANSAWRSWSSTPRRTRSPPPLRATRADSGSAAGCRSPIPDSLFGSTLLSSCELLTACYIVPC